jgi:steroid delta-isomerase-like uncharacterized protein
MTAEDIRRLAARHVDTFQAHDPALLALNHTDKGIVDSPSAGRHEGREQIEHAYERWFAAFPDLELQIENVVADTNQAAVFVRVSGTHRGDFMGLRATGKRIEFPCVLLQQFERDLIVYERRVYDFSSLMIQLGLLKVKPS